MKWFRNIFRPKMDDSPAALKTIQDKFASFLSLLDKNNQVLKLMSDMEDKSQGEYLFDMNYIRTSLAEIQSGVKEIIKELIAIGGKQYEPLRSQYDEIESEVKTFFPEHQSIEKDDFVIPLERLGREKVSSVGRKSAQLGEMKSRLGLQVPDGFAISTWAYRHFMEANNLQALISEKIHSLDIKHYDDLERVSKEIQDMVTSSPVPEDLAEAIRQGYDELEKRIPSGRFAIRSSARKDTHFSFAGQYETYLNVRGDNLLDRYRDVLASKFSPKAIYYFLSHTLSESGLAMGECCITMVDAVASGVTYTRDPVRPEEDCLLINSIYGLGKYLVDGTLTPDVFRVSRTEKTVKESHLATKPVRLVMQTGEGTVEEKVPESEQELPSIGEEHLTLLTDIALKIENHYGCPQDIEWAIDGKGEIFLLQTRPLQVVETKAPTITPDLSKLEVIISGGTTICPGAGGGPVFHASTSRDLSRIPQGVVLVTPNPFPGLVTAMDKVNGLVAEVGSVASHMATIAREYRIPTLTGVGDVSRLAEGQAITVDATDAVIYSGIHQDLISARRPEYELFDDMAIFNLLEQVLEQVSPLNLIDPRDKNFTPENCITFHDITRFAHQRGMEEMFLSAQNIEDKEKLGLRLETDIPLPVNIIYVDRDMSGYKGKRRIRDDELASIPMRAFWDGVKKQGWPLPPPVNAGGFMKVMITHMTSGERGTFAENSFAILGEEYMLLSLYLGYHFTTIEAMCAEEVSKNYVRMQFKEGGTSLDRRVRRIRLIMNILSKMGFENSSKGDFLDSMVSYQDRRSITEKLYQLGRITMMTKQLDMALSNDAIARWYTEDFMKKLGLAGNDRDGV
jgi:pyruvate,water dikinase